MRAGPIRAAKGLLEGTKSPPISEFPAQAGTQTLSHRQITARWAHACAKTVEENKALTQPSPTGRGLEPISPLLLQGERVG